MLSVALITAVATMYASGLKSLIVYEKYVKGDFHVEFMDVPSDDVKTIKNNNGVENVYLTQEIGYAPLKDSKNSGKPYAYVMGFDKGALENLSIRLTSGRLPQNEDEIIIPTHLKTNGRMDIENNKEITLEVGERVSGTYKLNQYVGYDADIEKVKEIIIKQCSEHKAVLDVRSAKEKKEGVPIVKVLVTNFLDYSIELRVTIVTKDVASGFVCLSDLRQSIKKAFD